MSTGYAKFTTKDGAWNYGYAEYNKKLSDASGVSAYQVSDYIYTKLPSPLNTLYAKFLQEKVSTEAAKALVNEPALVPTYYIWAHAPTKEPKLRLAGEWYFDSTLRDSYFATFRSAFDAANLSDAIRVTMIGNLKVLSAANQPFSITGLAKAAKEAAVSTVEKALDQSPEKVEAGTIGGGNGIYMLAVAVGVGVIVWLLRRK
jgi:hypothetical protein